MRYLLIVLLLLVISGCEKDDVFVPPTITIVDSENISASVVNVDIEFSRGSSQGIVSGGVIYGQTSNLEEVSSLTTSIEQLFESTSVALDSIEPKATYYAKAFVEITPGEIYYSEIFEFNNEGPTNITLAYDSIIRGESIVLKGNNLSDNTSEYMIEVDDFIGSVQSATFDSIVFNVAIDTPPGFQKLLISINGGLVFEKNVYIQPWSYLQSLPYYIWENGEVMAFDDEVFNVMDRYLLDLNDESEAVKTNEVWKLDLKTNTWEHVTSATFPGEYRKYAKTLTHNGVGYLCMGLDSNDQPLNEIWEFNPELLSWSKITEVPDIFTYQARILILNNNIYFYEDTNFRSFNLNSQTWKVEPSFDLEGPVLIRLWTEAQYSINGVAYYLGYDKGMKTYKYDPSVEEWSLIGDAPYYHRYGGMYMVVDGVGILGNGYFFSNRYPEYFTFNPETGSWQEFYSAPEVFAFQFDFSANSKNLFVKNGTNFHMFTPKF